MTVFDEEAIEAVALVIYRKKGYAPWDSLSDDVKRGWRNEAIEALAAAEESLRARGMVREGENVAWMAYDEHGIGYEQHEFGPVAIIQIKEPTTQNPEVKGC